ncbi:MAG: DUF3035 domain-containing protein [Alphaproteobacteria bacterium]|nr:DUF3035 domain-containing protein [Alphaproteobacteria bacterium]
MKKIFVFAVLSAVLCLSACGLSKKSLGLSRQGPDESNVKTNEPLVLPPEYNVRPQKSLNTQAEEESVL